MIIHRYGQPSKVTTLPACKASAARGGTVAGLREQSPFPWLPASTWKQVETVTWKVVDRTHLLLVRLPERKPLQGVARPSGQKKTRRGPESHSLMGTRSPQDKLFGRRPDLSRLCRARHLVRILGAEPATAVPRRKTSYDLRWKVARDWRMEEVPMQKSSLQEFEAKRVIHEMGESPAEEVDRGGAAGGLPAEVARSGWRWIPRRSWARGGEDTYNLLAGRDRTNWLAGWRKVRRGERSGVGGGSGEPELGGGILEAGKRSQRQSPAQRPQLPQKLAFWAPF